MINLELLNKKIKEKGLKLNYIAEKLNLSYYGFSKKLNGKTEFKLSEVTYLSELLGISSRERDQIFFSKKGA